MKMKLKRTINDKEVIEIFRTDKLSVYEKDADWCGYPDKEHPCVQYIVDESTGDVLFELQANATISVKAVL